MLSFSPLAGTTLLLALVRVLLSASSVHAAAIPTIHDDDSHGHVSQGPLPDSWHQDDDHFAHSLFRRQTTTSPSFPDVGSPTWAAAYPAGTPDSNAMPQGWKDALNAAVQAGKIPSIPQATATAPNTVPVYPSGVNPAGPDVCSYSYGCRISDMIFDAPQGVVGLSFDDGPLAQPSDNLYAFLRQNQLKATHFYIGVNILQNWKQFNTAFQTNGDDIAVHTWTHPYMTGLSNADIVAQLGWTLQIIYNTTGGRLARYWRPPYGNTDHRVNAIAREVFGLTCVIWNHDTGDWQLGLPGGPTPEAIQGNMQQWLSGPQNPGLIILEHELSQASVQSFMTAYPLFKQYNWNVQSLATMNGQSAYQNANGDTGAPTLVPLTAGGLGGAGLIAATGTTSSSSSTSTPPSPTSSSESGRASAVPGTGAKANGVAPMLRSCSLTSMLSVVLALSLCLI